jgi:tetratricopeptide (TPR) repeat protein
MGNKEFDLMLLCHVNNLYLSLLRERSMTFCHNCGHKLSLGTEKFCPNCGINLQGALEHFDKAIELDPNNALAWNNKGNTLFRLGRYNEALACIDKAIEIDPNYSNAYSGKGAIFFRLDKYDEAMDCYNKAIELDPNNALAWNNKINLLNEQKKKNAGSDRSNA